MEFSNTTNRSGIIQRLEYRTSLGDNGISNNTNLLKNFTADVNDAYSRVASIIIRSDGKMRWDDPNHSDTPVADFNLVSGQKNYNIFESAPTALQDWLEIDRVEILDQNDNGVLLTSKPAEEIDVAISEFESTNFIPKTYRFNGTEIFLDPAPNYNKTSGGTIYFNRCPSYFTYTDTTKRPGFATIFHELLVLWPLYRWSVAKNQTFTNSIRNEIVVLEKELEDFYGRRLSTQSKRIRPANHDNR